MWIQALPSLHEGSLEIKLTVPFYKLNSIQFMLGLIFLFLNYEDKCNIKNLDKCIKDQQFLFVSVNDKSVTEVDMAKLPKLRKYDDKISLLQGVPYTDICYKGNINMRSVYSRGFHTLISVLKVILIQN